jgi:hypothetical protein
MVELAKAVIEDNSLTVGIDGTVRYNGHPLAYPVSDIERMAAGINKGRGPYALYNAKISYRRNLWQSQDAFVELWCEKDAIAAILAAEAETFGVRAGIHRDVRLICLSLRTSKRIMELMSTSVE